MSWVNINQRHHNDTALQHHGTFATPHPAVLTYLPLRFEDLEDTYKTIHDLVDV